MNKEGREIVFKIQDVTSKAAASANRPSDKLHQTRDQYKWYCPRKATPSMNALSIAWGRFQSCWGAAYTAHNWAHYQSITGGPGKQKGRQHQNVRWLLKVKWSVKGSCPRHNAWCLIRFDLVLKPRHQKWILQVNVEEENRELTTFSLRRMDFGSLLLWLLACVAQILAVNRKHSGRREVFGIP